MDERLGKIEHRIGGLEGKVTDHTTSFNAHMGRQDKTLEEIRGAVIGDGASGLMAKYQGMDRRVESLEDELKAAKDDRKWLFRAFVGAIIAEIVVLAGVWMTTHK